jgi:YidC/Oxa1 family membrane protein insertase
MSAFLTLLFANSITNGLHAVFGPLVDLFKATLAAIEAIVHSWGWAIVILTIIVRLALMPLTVKQYHSTLVMQALQPKIKALQAKYKKDRQKLQQETMKLYQEYRVNPFASCLPLLLQIPIFICLYYSIRGTPEIADASFLWIPSLGQPNMPLFALYIVSQVVSTELMMAPNVEKQQKWIMRAMPVMFIFILRNFPSGLMLYWVTTNLWTIGQQVVIKKILPHPDILLERQAAKGAKRQAKGGGLMQRFTEAQKAQAERVGKPRRTGADATDGDADDDTDDDAATASTSGSRPARKRPTGTKSTRPASGKRPAKTGGKRPPTGRTTTKRPKRQD